MDLEGNRTVGAGSAPRKSFTFAWQLITMCSRINADSGFTYYFSGPTQLPTEGFSKLCLNRLDEGSG